MYGVVLMMALSGGADAPAMTPAYAEPAAKYGDHGHKEYRLFGGRRGHGCCGGGYGGCCGGYGGGYGGCCGGGGYYGGCCGGGGYYGGCCGGGYGGYYGGCTGGAYGSWGGGAYGTMPYDGGYGGTYYGTPIEDGRRYDGDRRDGDGNRGGERLPLPDGKRNPPEARSEAPATLVVSLPSDAALTIDGSATRSTSGVRTFLSPPLQPDKTYQYTLKATLMRDGKPVERTKDVTVRAGQTSEVRFDFGTSAVSTGE